MSHSIVRLVPADECEAILRDMNEFIDREYTRENALSRRAHVYEYGTDLEAFAFPIHCPGSPATDHLPGYRPEALPKRLSDVTRRACEALRLERGRVLLNVGRYAEHSSHLTPHYDGELFDFTVEPNVRNHVRSGIRPSEVALLTLRNETERCGTTLHDAEGKVIETRARAGELLVFDNTLYQHGVSAPGANVVVDRRRAARRWVRFTIGWRALEEGYRWNDDEPLVPIAFEDAVAMHDAFLANDWQARAQVDVARGTFPFPTDHV